jgi:type II secretory pathway component PulF
MPSSKHLSRLCDTMATLLDSGVPVSRALQVAARQAPTATLRGAAADARERVENGAELADALRAQGCFRPMFLNLVEAGEMSGRTDRIFAELSSYYEFQTQLRRAFLAGLVMPALEYIGAILVLALAQYIMGMFSESGGTGKAIGTLVLGYGIPAALIGGYFFLNHVLRGSHAMHEVLLRIPVLQKVVRSLALARFSLVMHMMLEAGVAVEEATTRACEATANGAFIARSERVREAIRRGENLTSALDGTGLFPQQYLEILSVAEESGKLTERFHWLAEEHQKQAKRSLTALTAFLVYLIWALVGAFILYFIVSFFARYVGALNRQMGA